MPKRMETPIGYKCGRLTVLSESTEKSGRKNPRRVICKCECGKAKSVILRSIVTGTTRSCGCLIAEKIKTLRKTHGMSKSKIFHVWYGMKKRINNPKDKNYKNYGGRGIGMDEKWRTFEGFMDDMGSGYKEGLSLERIDNNGWYCKENCKWIPLVEQAANRRDTRRIIFNGLTKPLRHWAHTYGINEETLRSRLEAGIPFEQAIKMKLYAKRRKVKTN